MLPIIPFEVLIPLTIFATLLCLGAIAAIVGRRAQLKWWSREGNRMADQVGTLILAAREKRAAPETLTQWLGRRRASRIDGLVRAIDRLETEDGGVRDWMAGTPVPAHLAEIVSDSSNGKRSRGARWSRVAAAQALARLRVVSTMPALARAMDDEDTEVGYAAANAVSALDVPEAGDALLTRISTRSRLNNARLAALIEPMTCDLTEVFRKHLGRDDVQALFWTATLIGQKEVFDLVVEVRPLLSSDDPNVRAASCECIGELKIPLTDRWLAPLLKDDKWFVQSHAAKALGEHRAAWAVDELVELLQSNEWWLRQNAADALVKIGRDSAEPVERILWSEDRFARHTAVEILERIGWIHSVVDRAVRDDPRAESFLKQFGTSGGLGYLENALFTIPEDGIPILLGILRELGDDATYGRVRAASEQIAERFRPLALSVAAEVRAR